MPSYELGRPLVVAVVGQQTVMNEAQLAETTFVQNLFAHTVVSHQPKIQLKENYVLLFNTKLYFENLISNTIQYVYSFFNRTNTRQVQKSTSELVLMFL